MPPVSSFCNPIETLWALVKREWRKSLDRKAPEDANETWMRHELIRIVDTFSTESLLRLSTCHFKEIIQYLESIKKEEETVQGPWRQFDFNYRNKQRRGKVQFKTPITPERGRFWPLSKEAQALRGFGPVWPEWLSVNRNRISISYLHFSISFLIFNQH